MSNLIFRKASKDLLINKRRTVLVLLAMIIGMFGVIMLVNTTVILNREMSKNYINTNPASATLWVDNSDKDLLEKVKNFQGIKSAELRRTAVAQVDTVNGMEKEIDLYVVPSFENMKITTFKAEKGNWPPRKGEILIERGAMDLMGSKIGDSISVKLPGYSTKELKLSGTVHAPALSPAWMENKIYGFITPDTFSMLGGSKDLNELKIIVADNELDKRVIEKTAYKLKDLIEGNNYEVKRIEIPTPGKHPHASQMQTLLFILEFFGVLTFVLSTIIVANMISAIMAQQISQIGIMKAIGAKTSKIAFIYLSLTFILGMVSTIIAVLAGTFAARAYAAFGARMLNFEIYSNAIPLKYYAIEILFSVFFPMFIALFSILKASKITVLKALQSNGVSMEKSFIGAQFNFIPRPMRMVIRNVFRKRTRLFFTLCVLSLGGALFITSMNISTSMNNSMLGVIGAFKYDASISLAQNYKITELENKIKGVSGVKAMEIWGGAEATCVHSEGLNGDNFKVLAVPTDTKMLEQINTSSGRWLREKDTNEIVINQHILFMEPGIKLGDTIKIKMDNKTGDFIIVGIVQELMSEPKAYVNQKFFSNMEDKEEQGQGVMIITEKHDEASITATMGDVKKILEAENIHILKVERLVDIAQKVKMHLMLLAAILIVMSLLGAIVGGMGLSTTMSINVMERTRELGIMRAIGASEKTVTFIILGEGILIGIMSCIIASLVSIPLSIFISDRFGTIFFETPMRASISPVGIYMWTVASILFAALSSIWPAIRVSKQSIREILTYE
jgi:putative ABC transport system permease protein